MNRLQSLYDAANKECMNDQHQFNYHYEMWIETLKILHNHSEQWEEQKASGFKYNVVATVSLTAFPSGHPVVDNDIIGKLLFTSTEYNKTISILVRVKIGMPLGKAILRKTPRKVPS